MAEESTPMPPGDIRFDPYAPRHYEGATEHSLTNSTHMKAELKRKGQENAEVYDWKISKLPVEDRMDIGHVRNMILSLYSDSQSMYANREFVNQDQHRSRLIEETPEYEELATKMPRLFLAMTEREVSQEKRQHTLNMIAMQMDQNRRGASLKQREAEIAAYSRHHWVRKAEEGEEEEAVASGRGMSGKMVEMPAPDEYQRGGGAEEKE